MDPAAPVMQMRLPRMLLCAASADKAMGVRPRRSSMFSSRIWPTESSPLIHLSTGGTSRGLTPCLSARSTMLRRRSALRFWMLKMTRSTPPRMKRRSASSALNTSTPSSFLPTFVRSSSMKATTRMLDSPSSRSMVCLAMSPASPAPKMATSVCAPGTRRL